MTTPEDPEGDGILNVGNQLNAPPSDWSTAKLLQEMHQQFQRLSVSVPQINCTMTLGCWEEFPLDGLQPETWEPSSDPSAVIGPDYVDIRRINVSFGMSHGTLRTHDSDSDSDSDGGVDSEFYFRSKVERRRRPSRRRASWAPARTRMPTRTRAPARRTPLVVNK